MSEDEGGFLEGAAPILGVAAGTFAAAMGADMIGVPARWAPWGTAAIGTIGALTRDGWVRNAAIGVAAAGASIGILRMLGILGETENLTGPVTHHRQADVSDAGPRAEVTRDAPAADAITQADLQKAIADVVAKHEAQVCSLQRTFDNQLRELRHAYESRIDEISASYERRVASQDETISNLLHELRKAQAASAGPRLVHRDASPTDVEETPVVDQPASTDDEEATVAPAPEAVSKAQAVFDLLSQEEAAQLQQIIAAMPPEAVAMAEAHLAKLEPAGAVDYLRSTLLAPSNAA